MAYVKNPTWQDGEAGGTRIDAADLNHMEEGIEAAALTADSATSALAGKANTAHTHVVADVTDATATGQALMTAASAAAARATIGAGTSSLTLGTTAGTAAEGNHTHASATFTGNVTVNDAKVTAGTTTDVFATAFEVKRNDVVTGIVDNYTSGVRLKAASGNVYVHGSGDSGFYIDSSGVAQFDNPPQYGGSDLVTTTNPGLKGRYVGVNAQTGTTYTPILTDEGKLVTLTNAAAITVTLPQDSALAFPVGGRIDFLVGGAGMVTFVAGTGASMSPPPTPSGVTRATGSAATAIKVAANTWAVVGDLA